RVGAGWNEIESAHEVVVWDSGTKRGARGPRLVQTVQEEKESDTDGGTWRRERAAGQGVSRVGNSGLVPPKEGEGLHDGQEVQAHGTLHGLAYEVDGARRLEPRDGRHIREMMAAATAASANASASASATATAVRQEREKDSRPFLIRQELKTPHSVRPSQGCRGT
ncbi:hypothetical protein GQ607_002981, partial [Colletotrichum asianum]